MHQEAVEKRLDAMKIIVLGAGAIGSIIAGHLTRAGEDVTIVARGERAVYLKEHGITITGLVDFNVPCSVVTDSRELSVADVLIVTVKTYDMESALSDLGRLEVDCVLSLQNGVMKNEQLAGIFGKDKTLGATAVFSGEVLKDGAVRFTFHDSLYIGELPKGTSARVRSLVDILKRSGIYAKATTQIQTSEWAKFVSWMGFTALSVLTRQETCKFLSDPDMAVIVARIMKEAASLTARLGIPLEDRKLMPVKTIGEASEEEAVKMIRKAGAILEAQSPEHKVSTLQDLERGRHLEVEETLGYVVIKAGEQGVPVPTIETCYRLISGINRFI